ncbi:hypothetical protein BKA67DRAFT_225805 [Truncatella angustata]|uniref:Uncharacterized protein n=1 Tax=Truncatella angustata TaxID=152316 RepID=A0A9P8UMT5_9PEZI|nr:uncharacterized protein BKA67DRAFT_225805 [Truncatella angustata]KAH6655082.1 hypothetical protein BKA67DRAFT_225805 [Truncatella angustata]
MTALSVPVPVHRNLSTIHDTSNCQPRQRIRAWKLVAHKSYNLTWVAMQKRFAVYDTPLMQDYEHLWNTEAFLNYTTNTESSMSNTISHDWQGTICNSTVAYASDFLVSQVRLLVDDFIVSSARRCLRHFYA